MLGLRTFGLRAVMSSAKIVDMLMMAMEMFARCLPDVCQMFASLVRNNCSQMEMLHSVMRNKGSHHTALSGIYLLSVTMQQVLR